jgi:hypothetical protein
VGVANGEHLRRWYADRARQLARDGLRLDRGAGLQEVGLAGSGLQAEGLVAGEALDR